MIYCYGNVTLQRHLFSVIDENQISQIEHGIICADESLTSSLIHANKNLYWIIGCSADFLGLCQV